MIDQTLQLIDAYLDQGPDSLTASEIEALDQLVATDELIADLFARRTLIHTLMIARAEGVPATAMPDAAPEPEPLPIYRKGYEPKPSRFRPHHYVIAAVAAAVFAACGVAVYLLAFNAPPSAPDPQTPNTGPRPVATLIHSTGDLRTPGDFVAEGDDYPAGVYSLSGGTAEFMLTNAVNVKLHGRSRMVMHNDRNVSLKRGRAAFVVPRDATGFAVRLPGQSKIIDLGTAFEVEVDEANRTRLVVTDGTVAWESGGDVAVLIEAGQRARLVNGLPVIFGNPNDMLARYTSDLPETMAIASFEPGVARLHEYLDASIATVPADLADLPAIIPPRGENIAPGAAYAFTLKQPARLYLLVHDRGGFAPVGWERTEHAVAWTVSDISQTDTVYTRLAEPGEVTIPPHTGQDTGGLRGVPHVCLIAPLPEPVEKPTGNTIAPQEGLLKGTPK